jgi:hypothetical protein
MHLIFQFTAKLDGKYWIGDCVSDLLVLSLVKVLVSVFLIYRARLLASTPTSEESVALLDPLLEPNPTPAEDDEGLEADDDEDSDDGPKTVMELKKVSLTRINSSIDLFFITSITVKCASRLFQGVPSSQATGDSWFWAAISASIVFTVAQTVAFNYHLNSFEDPEKVKKKTALIDEDGKGKKKQISMAFIFALCRPDWKLFCVAFTGLSIAAAGESTIPFLLGRLVDAVAIVDNTYEFHKYMVYLICTAAGNEGDNNTQMIVY